MTLDAENVPIDLRDEDFNVIVKDMDIGIPEQVDKNEDGSYTVFLNARYTYERCVDSMDHAWWHVRDNDWEKPEVKIIETRAHKRRNGCA